MEQRLGLNPHRIMLELLSRKGITKILFRITQEILIA
nr:MAG TPA: hypothetical protein [Caudoviricetes sp.]DAR39664.1 MAG TPA: hypothetical protein [Caudoviricetes sp.]